MQVKSPHNTNILSSIPRCRMSSSSWVTIQCHCNVSSLVVKVIAPIIRFCSKLVYWLLIWMHWTISQFAFLCSTWLYNCLAMATTTSPDFFVLAFDLFLMYALKPISLNAEFIQQLSISSVNVSTRYNMLCLQHSVLKTALVSLLFSPQTFKLNIETLLLSYAWFPMLSR